MMDNMDLWHRVKLPPKDACKIIEAGRMKGKTDINPMWRIQALTENFGICGIGWYYDIVKLWTESGSNDQKLSFAEIKLYVKVNGEWSKGISGTGGSMQVTQEKNGLHNSDECYKMAITDALSVACKMLGIGASVYSNFKDFETKYKQPEQVKVNAKEVNNKAIIDIADNLKKQAREVIDYLTDDAITILKRLKTQPESLTPDEKAVIEVAIETARKIMIAEKNLDEVT